MIKQFNTFLKEYNFNQDNDTLIIASSGGPDSIFLSEMARLNGYNIVVAHFNHELRGSESDGDQEYVYQYCLENNLTFETANANIYEFSKEINVGIEEAARIKRYEFLEYVRSKYGAKYILTGHHLDDSIETLLFNIFRGTKINGLVGMTEKNGYILRPLLHFTKNEILDYLHTNNVNYRIDSTNKENIYTRNKIRLDIIPVIEDINPRYRSSLVNFMEYNKELLSFINRNITDFLQKEGFYNNEYNGFSQDNFKSLDSFIKREMLRYLYSLSIGGTIGLNEGLINEGIKFIENSSHKAKKDFKTFTLVNEKGTIFLS